tara:strand:- start:16630 stop:17472 length:843 start_codon:yes stop_codon:yes gene_type:complete
MNIGIIGNGFVGSAIVSGFMLSVDEVKIFDVDEKRATHTFEETVNASDFIFVCVPTPMKSVEGGKIDLSIMDRVISDISRVNNRSDNIVIIKSTVIPGTVESYIKRYPSLNIAFSPEFLTERAARLDFINSSRIVIGGRDDVAEKVEELFRSRFPYKQIIKTDVSTAQFIKYMANCFFSVKVSFMNEMRQGADILGIDWKSAMEGFITDGRIGNSHLDVPGHDGHHGFGGKCFPKDLNSFISLFEENNIKPTVMKSAWEKNLEVRDVFDWAEIKGAVSDK